MKKLVLGILLLVSFEASSQSVWATSYGDSGYDFARDVKQDTDTGYAVTGSSSSFGPDNGEAYLLKLDQQGNFVWSYNYGSPGSDWGQELVITNDSTYAIAGYTNGMGEGGFDFYLIRAAANGIPMWQKTYGGSDWDKAYGLVQLPDSGFVIVGESYSFGGMQNGYAVRTDKDGDTLWTHVANESQPSFFKGVAFDGDSLLICGGIGDGGSNTYNGYTVKMALDGVVGWTQNIGQIDEMDYLNAVYYTNGIFSMGGVKSNDYANQKEDMWMYRINQDGTLVSDTSFVNVMPENDGITDIVARSSDQDYYFIGYTISYGYQIDGEEDMGMGKMTITDVQFLYNTYGEAGEDIGYAIDHTYDGGVVVCGDTKFWSTGGYNAFVMKLDAAWNYPDWWSTLTYDSITTDVESFEKAEQLKAYPNPTDQYLYLPEFEQGVLYIHDLSGNLVKKETSPSHKLDVSLLEKGTYLITVITNENRYQKRFIKL